MWGHVSKRLVGGVGLVGIGSGLTLSYAFVILFFNNPLVVGVLVPAVMAVTVVAVAVWVWSKNPDEERLYQLAVWCSTVTLFAGALGIVNIYSEWMVGGNVESGMIMIANSASLGAVLGILIGYYDMDREQEHRRVQDKQAEIESLNERLTVLNRVLRHDIRNDVNLIEGYVDMAATDRLAIEEAFDLIREKTQEIVSLSYRARKVEDLLYEDRSRQSIDLVEMVRTEVIHLRDGHPDDVVVTTDMPEQAQVVGNELLQSVVDNLLENAVEHTQQSPLLIDLAIRERDGGYELILEDNGPGLPDHERRIFTRGEESELHHSSGMGLWLVNWIVPEFGGTIHLGDATNSGTRIEIWLPSPEDARDRNTARVPRGRRTGRTRLARTTGVVRSKIASLGVFSNAES